MLLVRLSSNNDIVEVCIGKRLKFWANYFVHQSLKYRHRVYQPERYLFILKKSFSRYSKCMIAFDFSVNGTWCQALLGSNVEINFPFLSLLKIIFMCSSG